MPVMRVQPLSRSKSRMAGLRLSGLRTNGSGIEKAQIRKAFLRHATSKIRGVEDLSRIHSLGFRGEALSSICAVSMVELITRTKDSLVGVRYCIEGEREADFSEIGAPGGHDDPCTRFVL